MRVLRMVAMAWGAPHLGDRGVFHPATDPHGGPVPHVVDGDPHRLHVARCRLVFWFVFQMLRHDRAPAGLLAEAGELAPAGVRGASVFEHWVSAALDGLRESR